MPRERKSLFRQVFAGNVDAGALSGRADLALWEVLLMFLAMLVIHFLTVCRAGDFWQVATSRFDDMDYVEVATIIRNWHFSGGLMPANFWGFPYTIAGVSKLLSIPELLSVVLISVLASLAVTILVHRLYGGWVAAVFLFVNYQWIQLSLEGGSEPLFMCLLYASFLAVRSGRWSLAGLSASLSATVRPVGVFALLAFAAVLVKRRDRRRLAVMTLTGLAIGVLYFVPVWIVLGSPLANFHAYRADWGPQGWPLTYPFGALISSFVAALPFHPRWYMQVLFLAWPLAALVGSLAIWLPRNRQSFLARYQAEALFGSLYTLFCLSYNNFEVVWLFSRFLIPVLPVLVFALRDWIPHDRRFIWGAAVLSALLASAALVHFPNVFGFQVAQSHPGGWIGPRPPRCDFFWG